jgi:hypothetical protein
VRHGFRASCVSAQNPVLVAPVATDPQVTYTGHWILRQGRRDIGLFIVARERQQVFKFSRIESRKREVEIGRGQILQLKGE